MQAVLDNVALTVQTKVQLEWIWNLQTLVLDYVSCLSLVLDIDQARVFFTQENFKPISN